MLLPQRQFIMDTHSSAYVTQGNGMSLGSESLAPLAFAGYAHFTALQVRGRKLRALDLHLARLRTASLALFGRAMPDLQVRAALAQAVADSPPDASLMAIMHLPAGEFEARDLGATPCIVIRTGPPAAGPSEPLRLALFEHERFAPEFKHVGEPAKTWFMRQAAQMGMSDAAFMSRDGRISEGSIWNLVFWDGAAVVWPQAPRLQGTMMGSVVRQLTRMGVAQREQVITPQNLSALHGAAVMNSWTPGVAVAQIGSQLMPPAPQLLALLHQAGEAEPWLAP